jgi:hypothetical protein
LARLGVAGARPLAGGFDEWLRRGLPLDPGEVAPEVGAGSSVLG